ncbi:L,D-transpeptidase [Clostridium sp. DL1XJH146]
MVFTKNKSYKINLLHILIIVLSTTIIVFSIYKINSNIKINRLLSIAENAYSAGDYKEAILALNSVIAFDKNNSMAPKLLKLYQEKYQKQKESDALAKKIFNERSVFLNKNSYNNYKVEVTVPYQVVNVYKNNALIRTMVCSTGIESKPTPTGYFEMDGKGTYFFSEKYGEGGFYWMNFSNNIYLFHSVPVDSNKEVIASEAQKLGEKASHGCVRLAMNDAKWFYNNVPCDDTLIYIH